MDVSGADVYAGGNFTIAGNEVVTRFACWHKIATAINEKKKIKSTLGLNNYPNPFNQSTTINYNLPFDTYVVLKVYNLFGHEIKTLINKTESKGTHHVIWDCRDNYGKNIDNGFYYCTLIVGDINFSRIMIISK